MTFGNQRQLLKSIVNVGFKRIKNPLKRTGFYKLGKRLLNFCVPDSFDKVII